jgi:hypothetical protein
MKRINTFPFNSLELQQFHLYAKYIGGRINNKNVLVRFENQFWFDHQWSFGMHRNYFYTLTFDID